MATSRRRLLIAAVSVPLAFAAMRVGDFLAAAGPALRPRPSGTSATRCAVCGSQDHLMLDPACPMTPRVGDGARA